MKFRPLCTGAALLAALSLNLHASSAITQAAVRTERVTAESAKANAFFDRVFEAVKDLHQALLRNQPPADVRRSRIRPEPEQRHECRCGGRTDVHVQASADKSGLVRMVARASLASLK